MTDQQLLERFVLDGDQTAFADLVRRHIDWVCSMATRLTNGNRAMAEDVTQAAFILLAKKSGSLRKESSISNWLFVVTRYCASNALRNERCRRQHEQEAAAMHNEAAVEHAPQWNELSPLLDELVGKLRHADRQAVLLRFYQRKTFPEIGGALRISEEAARKRVSRAIENLRSAFARKGIAVGAVALAATMSANLTQPASAALIASATTATTATASTSSMIKGAAGMLAWASLKPALLAVGCALGLTIVFVTVLQQSAPAQNRATAPTSSPSTAPALAGNMRYGRALTEDDKPIVGARVWQLGFGNSSQRPATLATATTDSDGRFAFPATGSTTGNATYAYVFIDSGPGRAFTGGVVYSPIASSPTEFRARSSASVRVKFLDPAGNPAAGMRVVLAGCGESRNGWRAELVPDLDQAFTQTTDAQGVCTFTNIPRGGMAWFNVLDEQYAQVGFPKWVTLNSEAVFEASPIQLELGASISGKLTFADTGKPAAGIRIMATAQRGGDGGTMTDDQGRFSMKQLHPGPYCVFPFLSDEMGRKFTAVAIENIQLQSGTKLEDQDLTLIAGGIVRGKITDVRSGRPLKDVGVLIQGPSRPESTHTIQEATTDENGVYLIHVAPGEQKANVGRLPAGLSDYGTPRSRFDVADGQTVDVDFKLEAEVAAKVQGRAVDPQGHPLSGVEVHVQRRDGTPEGYVEAVSDENGAFSIPVVESSARLRGRRGNWSTLQPLAPNGSDMTLQLHPNSLVSLRVAVRDPGGAPVRGAEITLNGNGDSGWLDARSTGDDGSYTFKRLAPDMNYSVRITADGFGMAQAKVMVKPGEQNEAPPIVLIKADGFVSGIVVDETGLPVANIRVSAGSRGYLTRSATTDLTGRFRIDKLVTSEPLTVIAQSDDRMSSGSANNVAAGSDSLVITLKSR